MNGGHISISISEKCKNLMDSYGEICVHCNCCGRFDEKRIVHSIIDTRTRQIQYHAQSINDIKEEDTEWYFRRIKNCCLSIRSFADDIVKAIDEKERENNEQS